MVQIVLKIVEKLVLKNASQLSHLTFVFVVPKNANQLSHLTFVFIVPKNIVKKVAQKGVEAH